MKYKSIRKKIINTISFICILVFVFSFSYLFFVVRPANEKNVIYLIRQNVETKAQEVNQWIEKRVVEYRTLAAIPAIKSMDVREITPIINEVNNRYTFNDQTMETFSFIGKNGFCWINAAATEDLIRYDDYINIYSSDQEFLIGNPVIDSQNRPVVVFYYSITGYTDKKESLIANVIKLSTDDHWQSLQKTLKPGMEQSFNQIVIPGFSFAGYLNSFRHDKNISSRDCIFCHYVLPY